MFSKKLFELQQDKKFYILLIFFSFTLFAKNVAQGNLLVTPKRVVFDGLKRSEELNLANTGNDSATYIISFIQIRMKNDGSVETITEPDSAQNFADKYLRIFPRRVTLAPNEAQTVKVQATKTNELEPGEYRSHLYFRAVPNEKPLGEKEQTKDSSISVKLIPIFGISLPVIVRQGESTAKLHLSNVLFNIENDSTPLLKLTFNRIGNMSVYGDVTVNYISPNGKITKVGSVKGLAVYTPNTIRDFHLVLDKKSGINYHTGKLQVVYTDDSPKPAKLAEEEMVLK
ncbi:MAG: fimbria/pilus periplasmic chaperone [Bacteroidota bacterium]|nr:fimbria/pilus periplasmic chaperone [Bacteroidota bacterium]